MLAVIAAPAARPAEGAVPGTPLNVWAEWGALTDGLRRAADPVTDAGPHWAVRRLAPPTPERLRAVLPEADRGPDGFQVVHFVCHVCPTGLALETAVGREVLVPTSDLIDVFARCSARVVFLNACETLAVAQALHCEAGVPCVIGTERTIYDAESCHLAQAFYGALARGAAAGEALDQAHATLVQSYLHDPALQGLALAQASTFLDAVAQVDPARYEEALGLFRAVGARLGEANVYLSLGRLALGAEDVKAGAR
jgi:hypothetical protein